MNISMIQDSCVQEIEKQDDVLVDENNRNEKFGGGSEIR